MLVLLRLAKKQWLWFFLFLLFSPFLASCGGQQPAGGGTGTQGGAPAGTGANWPTTLEEIASYQGPDRTEMLLEGAKREKEVNLYTSENIDNIQPILDAFMAKYPFLKANLLRLQGEDLVPKILSEAAAGKTVADVVSTGFLLPLIQEGKMVRFYTPEADAVPNEFKHPEGLWIARHSSNFGFAYNPQLVPPERVPKTYEDLLDPWWQGKITIEPWDYKFWLGLTKIMGEEKGWQYIEQLAKNKPVLQKGKTQRIDMAIAGQYPATFGIYLYRAAEKKFEDKAPIDYVVFDPTLTSPHMVGLIKDAPHPHAAMLLIDYLLSEEGQQKVADGGRVVVRRGVKSSLEHIQNLTDQLTRVKRVVMQEEWYENIDEVEKRINNIFGLK